MPMKFDRDLFEWQCQTLADKIKNKRYIFPTLLLRFSHSVIYIIRENISGIKLPSTFNLLEEYISDWYWYESAREASEVYADGFYAVYTLVHLITTDKVEQEYWNKIKQFYEENSDFDIMWEALYFLEENVSTTIKGLPEKYAQVVNLLINLGYLYIYPISNNVQTYSIANQGFDLMKYYEEQKGVNKNERN